VYVLIWHYTDVRCDRACISCACVSRDPVVPRWSVRSDASILYTYAIVLMLHAKAVDVAEACTRHAAAISVVPTISCSNSNNSRCIAQSLAQPVA
jgi:hypothetical protein